MLEPELRLRPPTALANQVEALQLAQRLANALLAARHPGEQREPEAAAEHRRGGQGLAALAREAIGARQDHLLDGRRHVDRNVVVEPPAVILRLKRTCVGK